MAVSHKYKVSFIHIPKNAGGSVQLALGMKSNGHLDATYHEQFNYPMFAIIRNPIDRFISSYEFALQFEKHPDRKVISEMKFEDVIFNLNKLKHDSWRTQKSFINDSVKLVSINNITYYIKKKFDKVLPHHRKTVRKLITEYNFTDQMVVEMMKIYKEDFILTAKI